MVNIIIKVFEKKIIIFELNIKGFYQKSGKLLFIGLDDAGKTTLLNLLKTNRLIQPIPSQHSTTQELVLGNMKFTTFDVGGHLQGILLNASPINTNFII